MSAHWPQTFTNKKCQAAPYTPSKSTKPCTVCTKVAPNNNKNKSSSKEAKNTNKKPTKTPEEQVDFYHNHIKTKIELPHLFWMLILAIGWIGSPCLRVIGIGLSRLLVALLLNINLIRKVRKSCCSCWGCSFIMCSKRLITPTDTNLIIHLFPIYIYVFFIYFMFSYLYFVFSYFMFFYYYVPVQFTNYKTYLNKFK